MSSDQSYAKLRGLGPLTRGSKLACSVRSFIQRGQPYLRLRGFSGTVGAPEQGPQVQPVGSGRPPGGGESTKRGAWVGEVRSRRALNFRH